MTFIKGQPAKNRKLPPDEVFKPDVDAGLRYRAIARKHGICPYSLRMYVAGKGWREPRRSPGSAVPAHPEVKATPRVGPDRIVNALGITMPRIPSIHGEWRADPRATEGLVL
ncbi:hypothetical protein [Pararhizobium sp.]|uniref:hypothetical protein n=1 Tax=Pararhizobium sp. TaxID=1977563 RepID=UPI0027246C7D|nr:hypothetical protein [Pararhizobium sp.]MDO9416985.1 hypothetical protein [Pararhizobium sp.]